MDTCTVAVPVITSYFLLVQTTEGEGAVYLLVLHQHHGPFRVSPRPHDVAAFNHQRIILEI
jgi:hypothetical protein